MTPDIPLAELFREAVAHHYNGRLAEAERLYLEVAARGHRKAEVERLLAALANEDGRLDVALSRWQAIARAHPDDVLAVSTVGALLLRLGRASEAADAFSAAAAQAPDNADVAASLGVALTDAGRPDEALTVLLAAVERWPDVPLLHHRMRLAATAVVPAWHVPMMNDTPRNEAFERAIRRAVAARGPAARVLDIGTGSGLLSMMAARAGAASVVTCELVAPLAAMARKIIEANGFADHIRVVTKKSTELAVGADLDQPADVLVSEILSNSVLTEGVLATFEDALARLVKPGAAVIPQGVTAVGCLAGGTALEEMAFAGTVSGFDLSAFTALSAPRLPIVGFSPAWTRLSADHDLVAFDLTTPTHPPVLERRPLRASTDGVAVGIVQWMRVTLDADTTFANPPETTVAGGWQQVLHTFPRPIRIAAGQSLDILAGHDRAGLILMPASG
ncbi:MAG: 50S ribosomal protein L11 methyltransferase [Alphaproteobacteria bacterium]|nr:50S ribosomal protein L11 methyltransferase [Alphaproteobacteria bacterium]